MSKRRVQEEEKSQRESDQSGRKKPNQKKEHKTHTHKTQASSIWKKIFSKEQVACTLESGQEDKGLIYCVRLPI